MLTREHRRAVRDRRGRGKILLVVLLLGSAACDNMQHQRGAQDVERGASLTADARREPPAHTVARGAPAPGDPAVTGFRDGQLLEKIPEVITPALLARGRDRFEIYCAVCHGRDGYGAGIVVRRGFPAPPSYHQPRLRDAPDGQLYDVITRGYGLMLPFADRLLPHDRWAVVAYLRALQLSQRVALADLPPTDRAHFSPAMKAVAPDSQRWERRATMIGAIAAVAAVVLACFAPAAVAPAWRCAVMVSVGAAIGSLVFALIHVLTGGQWGLTLRPFLLSGVRLLPWTWLLMLPLLFASTTSAAGGHGWDYGSPIMLGVRTVIYGLVFFLAAAAIQRAWPREGDVPRCRWIGAVGAIGLLFVTHLLVRDWLGTLDGHWRSTAFPIVWLSGQAVAGLAAAVLAAVGEGADLTQSLGYHRRLGIDWGSLLFASAMFWCYVAFSQYLIVWSGDLPPEASWFTRRIGGLWRAMPLLLVTLQFLAPLIVLLSRGAKQNPRALGTVAGLLLAAQALHTFWIVIPAFPTASPALPCLALLLTIALGSGWLNRYLAWARKELAR